MQFFGLPMPMIAEGLTKRQAAARAIWDRRREVYGETGFSDRGRHALRLNLVSAVIAKEKEIKSKTCRRGHLWTAETTRLTGKGRSCRLCEKLTRGQRKVKKQLLAHLKKLKIEAAKVHPDAPGGSAYKFREAWAKVKRFERELERDKILLVA
jgi:hypothetical protein